MPDRHNTIEEILTEIVPAHTACGLAFKIEDALIKAGHMQKNEELDPSPYRRMLSEQRYASRAVAPDNIALVFDPRRQYVQDEGSYQ
jgi:hypothetical protein